MATKYVIRMTDDDPNEKASRTFNGEIGSWDHVRGCLLHELWRCAQELRADTATIADTVAGNPERATELEAAARDLDQLTTAGDTWSWTTSDGYTYELFEAADTEGGQTYMVVVTGVVLVNNLDRGVARQVCDDLNNNLLAEGYQACVKAET